MLFDIRSTFLQIIPTFLTCDDGFELWGGFSNGFRSLGRLEVSKVASNLSYFRGVFFGIVSGIFQRFSTFSSFDGILEIYRESFRMVSCLRGRFRSQRWFKLRSPSEISVFFQDRVEIPLVFSIFSTFDGGLRVWRGFQSWFED